MFIPFDPTSFTSYLSLNWISMVVVNLIPSTFWIIKRKILSRLNFLIKFLGKELSLILKTPSGAIKIILIRIFVYIWLINLAGLLPYVFTPRSHLSITLSLRLPLWLGYITINFYNNARIFLANLIPKGTPLFLIPFIVLIEITRNITRPFTLRIRLSANIVAGHLLLRLLRIPIRGLRWIPSLVLMLGLLLLIALELGVSFIQGYVFTTLFSLYLSETRRFN